MRIISMIFMLFLIFQNNVFCQEIVTTNQDGDEIRFTGSEENKVHVDTRDGIKVSYEIIFIESKKKADIWNCMVFVENTNGHKMYYTDKLVECQGFTCGNEMEYQGLVDFRVVNRKSKLAAKLWGNPRIHGDNEPWRNRLTYDHVLSVPEGTKNINFDVRMDKGVKPILRGNIRPAFKKHVEHLSTSN